MQVASRQYRWFWLLSHALLVLPPSKQSQSPVTRLSASLADGLEVVSIDSMLNRHMPAEINHTCLFAGQNKVSQNLYEFSYSKISTGRLWLRLCWISKESLWLYDRSDCWSLAFLHVSPVLVQGLRVFVMDTVALGQFFLIALQFSHHLLFCLCPCSFVCRSGIGEWE